MVLYRKYRSQTLGELVGQKLAKDTLKSAFSAGRLSHAYLFCGPRGTGKTSTARILAKMVNCEAITVEDTQIPCNKCAACISITDGSNMDVIEMDGASNRGIEDIRNLKDTIKLAPTSAHKKVYIIDEVHMLSGDAFNALLKTLEEPPSHVLFILATTEVQKIPVTILSRVTRIDFKPATTLESVELIKKAAEMEKIEIEDEAALMLAKKANGSFRDAIKFLDQLSSYGRIDKKIVMEGFGTVEMNQTIDLLQSLSQKNPSEILDKLNKQVALGVNIKELTLLLLDSLRQILYIKNGLGEKLVSQELSAEKYQELVKLADKFETEGVVDIISNIQNSLEQSRFISIPVLPLEMALLESCKVRQQSGVDDPPKVEVTEAKPHTKPEVSQVPEKMVEVEPLKASDLIDNSNLSESSSRSDVLSSIDSPDMQKIIDRWAYILETVRAYNYSLEALLRSSKILECGENSVVIEVPYSFHQRILESAKSRDLLQSIFSDILGRQIKIATALGKRLVHSEELSNVEVAEDDEIVRIASEIFNSETVN